MRKHQKLAARLLLLSAIFLAVLITGPTGVPQNPDHDNQRDNHKQPEFFSFDYPGAFITSATAITPSGEIVGTYETDNVTHGFLLRRGRFYPIDVPSATFTGVSGINLRGEIVGDYVDSNNAEHGYLLTHGKFITIDAPGADNTSLYGIGANGDILGEWRFTNERVDEFNGFLLRDGQFTPIAFPGAIGTIPAMTAAQRIVGAYYGTSETARGFLLANGVYSKIDCPGATFTFLRGIDPEGNMVGNYATVDGRTHGALIKNGNCIRIDFPGSSRTSASGINPQGDIVGSYSTNGLTHGFLLRHFIKTANPVYSAAADFSMTSNPNSVWSYGFADNVLGPFRLYTITSSNYLTHERGWFGPYPGATLHSFPYVVAQPDVIPDVLDMGPGPSSYTIVRWTAPSWAHWDIVCRFFGTGLTTADVHILLNGKPVYNHSVNGSSVASFSGTLTLKPGDTIDFEAGPGPDGNNDSDSTGFNVTITPEL